MANLPKELAPETKLFNEAFRLSGSPCSPSKVAFNIHGSSNRAPD